MKRPTSIALCASISVAAISMAAVPSGAAPSSIGGQIFRDYNHDGSFDPGEPGWEGVTVTATAPNGTELSTTSLLDGTYSIPGTDSDLTYQVNFTWSEAWLESGPVGNDNGSALQFVAGGDSADFAVVNPADYCEIDDSALGYATTCFVLGEPAAPSDYSGSDAVVSIPGNASGAAGNGGTPPMPTHLAVNTVIGSTYGLSWQPSTERLFTSAFLKRHIGLGDSGISGIYAIDTTADFSTSATPWYSAIDAGSVDTNSVRGMATDTASPTSVDASSFGLIYKVGWGDIDIAANETTLFGVNLFDRNLYAIDIAAADSGSTSAHTNLGRPVHNCTNGVARPFAIELFDGNVWMSMTCTAENGGTTTDLSAAVYAFDLATSTWSASPAIDFPLDYAKGCLVGTSGCGYEPWTDTFTYADFNITINTANPYEIPSRPQPMVSDLEIDRDGYLTIAIRDRQGDQFGHRNLSPLGDGNLLTGAGAGDILLAAPNGDGTWSMESDGSAGVRTSSGTGTTFTGPGGVDADQGPGGGEFYWNDFVTRTTAGGTANSHSETAIGSLALAPGRTDIAATITDPLTNRLDAAGISWFETADGSQTHEYEVFRNAGSPAPAVSGKANALGDLEALCPPAPIQIGNRVWFDENNNGIQDGDELPIPGVTVTITNNDTATPDVTTVTDAAGQWIFEAAAQTSYIITFDSSASIVTGLASVSDPADLSPTSMDSGSNDSHDSDMDPLTKTISVTTGPPGANDHTIDAGFHLSGLELGNLVWYDENNNGIAENGEPGIAGVTVQLFLDTNADGIGDQLAETTTTNSDGHYNFAGLAAGSYVVSVPDQSAAGLPLAGLGSSTPTTGDPDDDVDNDDNGISVGGAVGGAVSGTVDLASAVEPESETLRSVVTTADNSPTGAADTDSNLTVDFGYYPLASLGNVVWYDTNQDGIQDDGEVGVAGVTVNLCDLSMSVLQTTVTDSSGLYLFSDLPVGEYMVCFDLSTLPEDYEVTLNNVGDDQLDSDAGLDGKTDSVTLGPGEQNLTLDLGIINPEEAVGGPEVTVATSTPPAPNPSTTTSPQVASGGSEPSPMVPVTGASSTSWLALFGSLSLATGLSLLALRRRVF